MKRRVILLIVLSGIFLSCKFSKYDEDYYYKIEENINGIELSCYGTGFGKYGQMLELKSTSIEDCFNETGFSIQTTSTDSNNTSYNELYLDFILNGYISSFTADFEILKVQGIAGFKISYTDNDDKETSLSTKFAQNAEFSINKEVKKISVYFKGYKFFPDSYSSISYKEEMTESEYKEMYKGHQVNNIFTIKNVCLNN